MKKYVAGLMFSESREKVALIRKNKPDWQKGLLNGIGGKIEIVRHEETEDTYSYNDYESSLSAMIREFKEETGVIYQDWNHFLNIKRSPENDLKKEGFSVDFYRCFSDKVFECKTIEDEEIEILYVDDIISEYNYVEFKTIDNLRWIILLALDNNPKFTTCVY